MNLNTPDYNKYLEIQKQSETHYINDPKNKSSEGHRFDPSNQFLVAMIDKVKKSGRVLDLGCHTGYHTEQLKELIGSADGIDINDDLLKVAHSYGRDYCIKADMHALPFEDKSFDFVFAHEVLEHSFDFNKVLSEIHRVLKPFGYLVFSVPCENRKELPTQDVHCSLMLPYEIWERVTFNGFKVVEGKVCHIQNVNYNVPWTPDKENYNFPTHLHAIVQKDGQIY